MTHKNLQIKDYESYSSKTPCYRIHTRQGEQAPLLTLCSMCVIIFHLFVILAGLIAYGTGCLACGLTGSLALAAATLAHGILIGLFTGQCLDSFHKTFPPFFIGPV